MPVFNTSNLESLNQGNLQAKPTTGALEKNMGNMGIFTSQIWDKLWEFLRKYGTYMGQTFTFLHLNTLQDWDLKVHGPETILQLEE